MPFPGVAALARLLDGQFGIVLRVIFVDIAATGYSRLRRVKSHSFTPFGGGEFPLRCEVSGNIEQQVRVVGCKCADGTIDRG